MMPVNKHFTIGSTTFEHIPVKHIPDMSVYGLHAKTKESCGIRLVKPYETIII